jgi:hypothetical protein
MDNEWIQSVEMQLDSLRSQVEALTHAVTQIPQINKQTDPSRPAGVVISGEAPAPLVKP